MLHFKPENNKSKIIFTEGARENFPRTPLWLSTGLT